MLILCSLLFFCRVRNRKRLPDAALQLYLQASLQGEDIGFFYYSNIFLYNLNPFFLQSGNYFLKFIQKNLFCAVRVVARIDRKILAQRLTARKNREIELSEQA